MVEFVLPVLTKLLYSIPHPHSVTVYLSPFQLYYSYFFQLPRIYRSYRDFLAVLIPLYG